MRIFLHILLLTAALARLTPTAEAFALLGVNETWQTPALGHNPLGTDIGFVKGITEGYRWPKSQLSYAFDPTFVAYFGDEGVKAVEEAIKIFNKLEPMSSIDTKAKLNRYPLSTLLENPTARALRLLDLKSFAMTALMEELGVGEPVRWTYTLRDKKLNATGTVSNYLVIQRNYDPSTLVPTNYVNGRQYKFQIGTVVFAGGTGNYEDAVEIPVDPSLPDLPAVAERGAFVGGYYTGLTRDDVGGLRHLYRKTNIFNQIGEGSVTYKAIDFSSLVLLTNLDLAEFSRYTLTNGPTAIAGQYPGIVITNSSITNFIKAVQVIGVTNELKAPEPWDPVGTPFRLVARNLYATNFVPAFRHKYANVFTNLLSTSQVVTYQTVEVGPSPWSPVGSGDLVTNTLSSDTIVTNLPSGSITIFADPLINGNVDFVVSDPDNSDLLINLMALLANRLTKEAAAAVGTNKVELTKQAAISETLAFRYDTKKDGGFDLGIVLPSLTNYVSLTNIIESVSNVFTGEVQFKLAITTFENVVQVAFPVTTTAVGAGGVTMEGADKLTFTRGYFYSGVGNSFRFTNTYSMTIYTNGQKFKRTFTQVQTAPDILFAAGDIGTFNNSVRPIAYQRSSGFVNRQDINGSQTVGTTRGGPGEIDGPVTMTFNTIGQGIIGTIPGGSTLESALSLIGPNVFVWGSFDGKTNAPIVYPRVVDFDQLERAVLKKP